MSFNLIVVVLINLLFTQPLIYGLGTVYYYSDAVNPEFVDIKNPQKEFLSEGL